MNSANRWVAALLGSALAVTIAIGATGVFAQEPETTPTPAVPSEAAPETGAGKWGFGARGLRGNHDELLAEALGITVEELDAAQQAARTAAIQQAVAEGRITQEQADQLLSGEGRGHFHGLRGEAGEYESLLADALGISVDELEAAKETARAEALAQAVAEGRITQEQADLIAAKEALREYVDEQAILADALGLSVAELEAARAEGQRLSDLIEAQGLDAATVREAVQQGHEAAVQQAVAEGIITQEQADQLTSEEGFFGLGGRRGRGGWHGFGGPRGGSWEAPAPASADVEA